MFREGGEINCHQKWKKWKKKWWKNKVKHGSNKTINIQLINTLFLSNWNNSFCCCLSRRWFWSKQPQIKMNFALTIACRCNCFFRSSLLPFIVVFIEYVQMNSKTLNNVRFNSIGWMIVRLRIAIAFNGEKRTKQMKVQIKRRKRKSRAFVRMYKPSSQWSPRHCVNKQCLLSNAFCPSLSSCQ